MNEIPDGMITVSRTQEGERITYDYHWEGGPLTTISIELLRQRPDISIARGYIYLGPYLLKLEGFDDYGNLIARRLDSML